MIKKLLFFSIVLSNVIVKSQSGITVVDSIWFGNQYRLYRLYVPQIYNGTPAPLVLNLHGYGSNALEEQLYTRFDLVADTAGCLVIYPQGTKDPQNKNFWNAGLLQGGVDDAAFLNALIDSISNQYSIDPERVYMTGLSNGGFMSQYMACFSNQKIAAIASVAGTMFTNWSSGCNPSRVVPVMHIHGTMDATVPYNGNAYMVSVNQLMNFWQQNNNCNSTPQISSFPNINTSDGCTAEYHDYSPCSGYTETALIKINGGGHSWPGGAVVIDVTNYDMDGSTEIWKFFLKHKLSQTLNNDLAGSNDFLTIYPNPSDDFISIRNKDTDINNFEIFDLSGKVIMKGNHLRYIDISHLTPGVYFVKLFTSENKMHILKFVKK